jgi:hypothetical protein
MEKTKCITSIRSISKTVFIDNTYRRWQWREGGIRRRPLEVTQEEWTQRVAKKIVEITENAKNYTTDLPPFVLFVASDTAHYKMGCFRLN